jgi:hypothetical protein
MYDVRTCASLTCFLKGWKCREEDDDDENEKSRFFLGELSVHVRSHFYIYSKDLRYLPTSDLEETLEFLACVAHGEALDDATKMVMLDALNTFDQDPETTSRQYTGFENQDALDAHLTSRNCCAL